MIRFLIEQGVDVNQKGWGHGPNDLMSNIQIAKDKMDDGFSYEIREKKPRYEKVIRMLKAAG